MSAAPVGVLLINLGTPDAPHVGAVRKYLREFLMDPHVIDIPWPARAALVYGAILPRRAKASAQLYQSIWSDRGSPLRVIHQELSEAVEERLGPNYRVRGAMRYGNPSIRSALAEFVRAGVSQVWVWPLYPQYSYSATESSRRFVDQLSREPQFLGLDLKWIEHPGPRDLQSGLDFSSDPDWIESWIEVARPALHGSNVDHVLFSFHGAPVRQLTKGKAQSTPGSNCHKSVGCCDQITDRNRHCYRAQCYEGARGIAQGLQLKRDAWSVAFQSRLGRTPWIQPFSDQVLTQLARQGTRRVAVLAPSFVADCLETLEEIQIRGREAFRREGGEELLFIPSLNTSERWVRTVCDHIQERVRTMACDLPEASEADPAMVRAPLESRENTSAEAF